MIVDLILSALIVIMVYEGLDYGRKHPVNRNRDK